MAFKIPSKRRRSSSIVTPVVGHSDIMRSSSVARSSPVPRIQPERYLQEQPERKASLLQSSSGRSSVAPSSRAGSVTPTFHSVHYAPSGVDVRAERDDEISEREDNDSLNEVVMAVDLRDRGTVGCCYYVARAEKLYMMEDVRNGGIEVIDTLKLHIQPTAILLSTRVDENVDAHLDPEGRSRGSVNGVVDIFRLPYILEVRPSPEFGYEAGINKLVNLRLDPAAESQVSFITPGDTNAYDDQNGGNGAGYTGRQGSLLRLSGKIDIESRLTIGCAGAVLTYLQRRKAVDYLPGDADANIAFRITAVEMFSLGGFMFVNADTLASLQILQSESHPQSHNQGPTKASPGSKEGLSVYGLFYHLARTPQGKYLLRQYFLRPSLDIDTVNERLDTASIFLRPDNSGPLNVIVKSLGQIKNMKTVTIHLRKGISNGLSKGGGIKSGVWSSLRSFAFHTLHIRDACSEVTGAEKLLIWIKVLEKFETRQLAHIGTMVSQIVDFSSSAEMHRTVVNAGVDDDLDTMKQTYDGIEDLLNRTSQEIAATIPGQYSVDLNVIFFPQIGFLISMPMNLETGRGKYEGGETEDTQWDLVFSTGVRVYYKDFRMRELDRTLGDMYAIICDKEIDIIHELGQEVLRYEDMLNCASEICGELDSLLALAQGARLYKLSRPHMTERNVINIKGGRHPLQELTVPSYIANDAFVVGGAGENHSIQRSQRNHEPPRAVSHAESVVGDVKGPSMLMMTGPNYSGKSVYLKQIALIVYMAHVGCFVPAENAVIGLTDKILTRIATRETVSKIQSAFMIDLQQVALAISLATCRSLVIIDEFGKGTESSDGAGLACGVFEHFLELGDERPKVLGATHFHEAFENGFLGTRPSLFFGHMQVRVEVEAADVEDQITYLYNFRPGRSNSSHGTSCAALNGVDLAIIARAEELIVLSSRGEDLVAACATMSEKEEEDLKLAEETARAFLTQDLRDFGPGYDGEEEIEDPRGLLEKMDLMPR